MNTPLLADPLTQFTPQFVRYHGSRFYEINCPIPLVGHAYSTVAIIAENHFEEVRVIKSHSEWEELKTLAITPGSHFEIVGLYSVRTLDIPIEFLEAPLGTGAQN